jgi:catenin alpha
MIPQIRSRAVEETLAPLIQQITILANGSTGMNNRVKGRSKRANVIVESFKEAIREFIKQGTEIAQENIEMRDELLNAVNDVRLSGDRMANGVHEYTHDPFSSDKRSIMLQIAKELLASVARLLTLADIIDCNSLSRIIALVQKDLENIRKASNQDELMYHYKQFGQNLADLIEKSGSRQADLNDPRLRDELASARATLKKHSLKLFTASKTLIRHPEIKASQAMHDFVMKEIAYAIDRIHAISTNKVSSENMSNLFDEAASLSAALDELDRQVLSLNPVGFNESKMRLKMENQLEEIISAVALMADSNSTRQNRRDRIVDECNALRQALQDLLNAYGNYVISIFSCYLKT